MKKAIVYIFVFGVLPILSPSVLAQTKPAELITYNFKLISHRTQEPLPGVLVNYKKLPYESEVGAVTTDANGQVTVYFRSTEDYSILIEPEGFLKIAEIIKPAEGASGDTNSRTISLRIGGIGTVLTLDNVNFGQGSSVLEETSYESLDDLVGMLNESSQMTIQLEGHTDFRGSPTANIRLSQDRVDAVKKYLVDKGIAETRIATKAFGGSQPLSRDNTTEARSRNRRVEVRITSDGSSSGN